MTVGRFLPNLASQMAANAKAPLLPRLNNRAGWRKGSGREAEWLIPPETWKAEICSGLNPTMVVRTLFDHGMLLRAGDGFQLVRRIGGANKRVYVLTAEILAGGGDEG